MKQKWIIRKAVALAAVEFAAYLALCISGNSDTEWQSAEIGKLPDMFDIENPRGENIFT